MLYGNAIQFGIAFRGNINLEECKITKGTGGSHMYTINKHDVFAWLVKKNITSYEALPIPFKEGEEEDADDM